MFDLFKTEQNVFTFDDYGSLMRAVSGAKRVFEFGPGASTLAMIEAGVESIVSAECNREWRKKAEDRLRESIEAGRVEIIGFTNSCPVEFDAEIIGEFDIAFVDSPVGIEARSAVRHKGQENCSRLNTVISALELAPIVLLHDAKRRGEQATLQRVSDLGHRVTMIDCVKGLARIERC
jgi:hypothetical protein